MPNPSRRKHRTWFIAWALLCAAGLAATEALTGSPSADDEPSAVSPECAALVEEIESRLADQRDEKSNDTALAWTRSTSATDDGCADALRKHFDGD